MKKIIALILAIPFAPFYIVYFLVTIGYISMYEWIFEILDKGEK